MHAIVVLSKRMPLLAAAALVTLALPVRAQEAVAGAAAPATGLQAELIRDVNQLERKYLALADAMAGKYEWRPAADVRSVGEVLMHVAGANLMIPTMAGVQPPDAFRVASMQEAMQRMQAMEKVTDPTQVKEALQTSFAHAKHAIASVSDAQLDEMTKMFGQDVTKRVVLNLLVNHMHEHLGQAIAYARSTGVTPPWSQSGN